LPEVNSLSARNIIGAPPTASSARATSKQIVPEEAFVFYPRRFYLGARKPPSVKNQCSLQKLLEPVTAFSISASDGTAAPDMVLQRPVHQRRETRWTNAFPGAAQPRWK